MGVNLVIAASAGKHGVSDEDIRHAYEHPIRVFELDTAHDDHRRQPGRDHHEISVVDGVGAPIVIHAMKARDKFLR